MNTNQKQLIDVYDVWYKPWWHSTFFYVVVSAIVTVVLLLLAYGLWRRFVKNKALSYQEIALLDLEKLQKKEYETDDELRDAYFTLTMIVKTYLSERYQISFLNKTDSEIVAAIKPLVPAHIFAILQEFFERSFQIKFAQAAVSQSMLQDDLQFAERIISTTMQKEQDMGNS